MFRAYPGIVAAGIYDSALRSALLAYKERGRRDLARPLARLLAAAASEFPGAALVPVPSDPRVAAARGGDHVLRLARLTGRPVVRALRLRGGVLDSAGLSPEQRRRNLAGAFVATPGPAASKVVLVDDIVTTAATLSEARLALADAGWDVTGAAAVAATPLRWGARPG